MLFPPCDNTADTGTFRITGHAIDLIKNHVLKVESGQYHLHGSPIRGILGATYAGRFIDVEGAYPVAKAWLENYETSGKERPELECQLIQSQGCAAANVFKAPFFRGRLLTNRPVSFQDFGPPPPGRARRGRYNAEGDPALYLCSSVTGVIRELGSPPPGEKLWIQRFQILPHLRLADARQLPIESLAAAVFWLIESGRDRSSRPPRLGERIGELVGLDYDGLIVPGVRGELHEVYWNVVMFHPENRWLRLVDKSVQPKEVS